MVLIPQSFREMPRWWHDGAGWLDELPERLDEQCRQWGLTVDGDPWHGSNALVLPVRRGAESLALRLTPPQDDLVAEISALEFWAGRGTVLLVDADPGTGATLLERLSGDRSLTNLPLPDGITQLGLMMRRLALPDPPRVRSTADIAATWVEGFAADWSRLGEPFEQHVLETAVRCAEHLSRAETDLAVNGDLHFGQLLAGTREPWLTVDPVLLRGEIQYDLARILWSRLDEMADDAEVLGHFRALVRGAEVDEARSRLWVLARAVDYWLWGFDHGLTEDPVRCERLTRIFAPTVLRSEQRSVRSDPR